MVSFRFFVVFSSYVSDQKLGIFQTAAMSVAERSILQLVSDVVSGGAGRDKPSEDTSKGNDEAAVSRDGKEGRDEGDSESSSVVVSCEGQKIVSCRRVTHLCAAVSCLKPPR